MASSSTIDGKQLDSRPSAEAKSNFYKLEKNKNMDYNMWLRRNDFILILTDYSNTVEFRWTLDRDS